MGIYRPEIRCQPQETCPDSTPTPTTPYPRPGAPPLSMHPLPSLGQVSLPPVCPSPPSLARCPSLLCAPPPQLRPGVRPRSMHPLPSLGQVTLICVSVAPCVYHCHRTKPSSLTMSCTKHNIYLRAGTVLFVFEFPVSNLVPDTCGC